MSAGRAVLILLLGSACGEGTTLVNPPPPPAFQIRLVPDSEDLASAQALGWAGGSPVLRRC